MDIYSYLKDYIDSMPNGEHGFLKQWGTDQLANKLLEGDTKNRIGICGSHRVGKTTLAKFISTNYDYEYRECSASPSIQKMDLNVRSITGMGIETRLEVQQQITKDYLELIKDDNIIVDRTPLDHLMYLISEVLSNSLIIDYEPYKKLCLNSLSKFRTIILVHPGIKVVDDLNKASSNPAYIEHLDNIITGLVYNNSSKINQLIEIPRNMTDINERLSYVMDRLE